MRGLPPGVEGIGDAQDDETSPFAGVEDAGAILESAGFGAEFANLSVFEIEDEHRLDGF